MLIDTKQLGQIKPCLYYSQIYDKNFYMNIHRHETLEIMYVSEGAMTLVLLSKNNEEIACTVFQGQFALIKSNLPHKLSVPDSSTILNIEFESFNSVKNIDKLFFDNAISESYAKNRDYCLNYKGILIFEDTHDVLQSLTRLQNCLASDMSAAVFELSYTLLLSQLISDILSCEITSRVKKVDGGNIFVKKALQYIHSNSHRNISLENICEQANCSPAYLERFFKEIFQSTVSKKINEIRINRAKTLLKNFSVSSVEVGKAVGFQNQQSFINNFREFTGCTPSEYRKQQRLEYKILHAYEKSSFNKKFNCFLGHTTGTFVYGNEQELFLDNPRINTLLYSGSLDSLFEKDYKKIVKSKKYLFIDTNALLLEKFDFSTFHEQLIEKELFDFFIGFYVRTEESGKALNTFIDFLHKFSPLKRIILDCARLATDISADFIEKSYITDIILPDDTAVLQKFISTKTNVWLRREIQSLEEVKCSVNLPFKNFGGIAYLLSDRI